MSAGIEPPDLAFFEAPRREAGGGACRFDLPGLTIRIHGLDDALQRALTARLGPHMRIERADDAAPVLDVALALEELDYFIPPPRTPGINPVGLALQPGILRYVGHRAAGWIEIENEPGTARLFLARGDYEPAERAIENFLRVAVAWRALAAGGALVHAASAVFDGRGYFFYGAHGAGKSTLMASSRRGQVVSDDLSLLLPGAGPGRLDVVGTPFRGTWQGGAPVEGRFPVAAGFRLVQAPEARVEEAPRAMTLTGLFANLPFVVDALAARPDLVPRIESVFASVPLARLHFRPDDSFWDAVLAWR